MNACSADVLSSQGAKLARNVPPTAQQGAIDCNVDPYVPAGWQLDRHIKRSVLTLRSQWLYLADGQRAGHWIDGEALLEDTSNRPTLNAAVLDHLLTFPELVPSEWGGRNVFFWGTVYRDSAHDLFGPYLHHDGGWAASYRWIGDLWTSQDPTALSPE